MADLTTIILTYNEELNIEKCINSVKKISKTVVVVDSYSTDRTVEIAKGMGAYIIQNTFINHANQFKHGLETFKISTQWILRLDADEQLTRDSANEIENICMNNVDTDINGIIVRFKVNFLGKNLRHGGIYPFRKLIIFKNGFGFIENREMDEHIVLTEGKSVELKNDSLHLDYKNLNCWIDKHNKYSTKEVIDYYGSKVNRNIETKLNKKAKIKRFFKFNFYYKLPMGLRPFCYFIYRYLIRGGFLDGKEGLIFAVLQAFWYRFLVDAKIYESEITNNE